ncbi:hypothetical protein H2200_001313 [Cladophialophora chaetospira]|uniref:TAFII55 protein conserved region domain-containing protein n=1 Tax=Cladophialophora chaetospira TaxID=386627 RepID=A0AA38XKM6_9EURO|nr:hypothetical protein H2200_001313 [Cladophialophora chaetospira]
MPRARNHNLKAGQNGKFTENRKKYEFRPEPETAASSFLTLKLPSGGLYRFSTASKATTEHPKSSAQGEDGTETNLLAGDEENQNSETEVPNSNAVANDAEPEVNESVQQPIAPALIAPEAEQAGHVANETFQAATVDDAAPPLAPNEPQAPPLPSESKSPKPKPTPRNGRSKAAGKAKRTPTAAKPKSRLHTPGHRQQREAKSILKPERSAGIRKTPVRGRRKSVVVDTDAQVHFVNDTPVSHNSNEENESPVAASDDKCAVDSDGDSEMSDASSTAKEKRPNLKLSFSRKPSTQAGGIQPAPVQTPGPQSATIRTPSIKLKFAGASTPAPTVQDAPKSKEKKKKQQTKDTIEVTPGSNKKRKHEIIKDETDDDGSRPAPAPPGKPPILRKLTFKNAQAAVVSAPKATGASQLLFKVKGKVPKRALGVGYDSELEETYKNKKGENVVGQERDPVIHEGFILRMQPGEDAEYLRKSIEDGKAGEILTKGGAAINLRMLDTLGRRGILHIKDHKYATSLVDLPCIVEGMKSWDKKGWIKSIDICQMLLVLGRCKDEEEARNYPLPEDVDSKTFQYAHGITAPMKWVRKRRFARTKRARVDDIESVERRVHALLEADKSALSTRFQLLDHDPREQERDYTDDMEDEEEYDEDEDAEGELDDYFGDHGASTPMVTETPVQADLDEVEQMLLADTDDKVSVAGSTAQVQNTLQPPDLGGDSSFAVTSTSATPSATAAATPISGEAGEGSSDEDEDEEGAEDEDRDDEEKEGDESKRQALEKIEDMTNKISEQRELLKKTTNGILKKKLARRIQDLEDDVAMMRKNAGLGGNEDDE